jgi:preprotein translocase subunit SecD
MPTNIAGRVATIVLVTLVFIAAIFAPLIQHPSWTFDRNIPFIRKTAIRPGIDMVGGTSLLYEIRVPADRPTAYTGDLAGQMMEALKRRVDPEGVRNLVWRPQGGNRLEIQMPLSGGGTGGASTAEQKRKDLLAAREKLEATNVHRADVLAAVEAQGGPDRKKLEDLAGGSAARK